MADTLTTQTADLATIPDASVIATDDAGAAGHVQIVKLAIATDGSATPLTADNTDGILVNLGTNNDITNAGTFAVQEDGAALTALQLIDDVVATDDTTTHATGTTKGVNIMAAATPTDGAVGANDIGQLAMSLDRRLHTDAIIAGQDADVTIADGGNSITVDNGGTFATQATLQANSGVDIGDVDVLSVAGTVTVDGSGVTQPISGTVTANLSATDNAVLDSIDANTKNVISTNNTTTSTLTSGSTFTGTGDDVSNYAVVTIQLDSSHDSATDGMTFQFSVDNSNWDDVYTFTYTAASGARRFQYPVTGQYFRVVYTNGGTGQTHFRVQTILHANNTLSSIHRLSQDVSPDRSAQVMKSAIIARVAGSGDFTPIQATTGGNLKISVQEISDGLDVGAGNAGAETQRVILATDQPAVTVDLGANNDVTATGNVAHDAADSGNPIKIGGIAQETDGTDPGSVAEADRVDAIFDMQGRQLVNTAAPFLWSATENHSTAQTDNELVAAPGANLSLYLTDVVISNGATAGNVKLVHTTAGSTDIIEVMYFAANGGAVMNFTTPIRLPANVNLGFTSVTSTTHSITVNGYTAP